MKIPLFQVDAFSDKVFKGNPAAVCILNEWKDDSLMQKISEENNLAETAFVVKRKNYFEIRWFTPIAEVVLCGHATLAAAHVLFQYYDGEGDEIGFSSQKSGILKVRKENGFLVLDFPVDILEKIAIQEKLVKSLGGLPIEVYKGKTDLMAVFSSQQEIEGLSPDYRLLSGIKAKGIIVTARGEEVDFVSRFFAPQLGINEDSATGSSHTTLTPYWAQKLKKSKLTALQLSKRQGKMICELNNNRVSIAGKAITYLRGEIENLG